LLADAVEDDGADAVGEIEVEEDVRGGCAVEAR
jgi:hypothetical protein